MTPAAGVPADRRGGDRVAIALGSNVGNRRAHLAFAVARLRALLADVRGSGLIESDAVGDVTQERYLNGVVVGSSDLPPHGLLRALMAIERDRGRRRPFVDAPRTLDLDLILFGDRVVDDPDLRVPHPCFRERDFVLGPLVEVAPDMRDPVSGLTARELLAKLRGRP